MSLALIQDVDLRNPILYEGTMGILLQAVAGVSSCLLSATTLLFP
jgi:hypothetical protein